MTQKQEYLFWLLASEIYHNDSPATYNIYRRLSDLLNGSGIHHAERQWDGQRQQYYCALYSSPKSKCAIRRIYSPCDNQTATKPCIKNPYRGGRVSKVPTGTRERVLQYATDGNSERKIADATGLSRKQVRYILGRK